MRWSTVRFRAALASAARTSAAQSSSWKSGKRPPAPRCELSASASWTLAIFLESFSLKTQKHMFKNRVGCCSRLSIDTWSVGQQVALNYPVNLKKPFVHFFQNFVHFLKFYPFFQNFVFFFKIFAIFFKILPILAIFSVYSIFSKL